jgi:hypothetical protein
VVAGACTKPNPNRCCVDEADCEAKGIAVGSFCDQGLVCRGNHIGVAATLQSGFALTNSILKNQFQKANQFSDSIGSSSPTLPSTVSFTTFYNTKLPCAGGEVILSSSTRPQARRPTPSAACRAGTTSA